VTRLWYDDAGTGSLEAWDCPEGGDGEGVFLAYLEPYDRFRMNPGDMMRWSVDYHPLGDPATGPEGGTYGPFATLAEGKARLEAAYDRYIATGDEEAGLEYLESKEYPWPGLA